MRYASRVQQSWGDGVSLLAAVVLVMGFQLLYAVAVAAAFTVVGVIVVVLRLSDRPRR